MQTPFLSSCLSKESSWVLSDCNLMRTGEDMFSKDRKACVPHQRGNAGCCRWVCGESNRGDGDRDTETQRNSKKQMTGTQKERKKRVGNTQGHRAGS